MIDHRQLIKEIPSGKFHSALMTSFSINLYYWDIQLLRTLAGKGINFVSALVDSDCLSDQLLNFSKCFRDNKPLDFSIHGYKMKGAFHPKIQFYAGRESVLALIGSGNLTITGHGRNLEVWSPIMVDNVKDPAYPFIRDVWGYLKSLYLDLGPEANNIVTSIEENCDLLRTKYDSGSSEYLVGEDSIRFFTNHDSSIFNQCREWIGDDKIKTITVMSPFYDDKAQLIKSLFTEYNPKSVRLIVEDGFGSFPKARNIPDYVKLYKWDKIASTTGKKFQEFFHSKCFFFEGKSFNYMLCGSANASVAAFGIPKVSPINQEACVGYKSASKDYFKQTGFTLTEPIRKEDIPQNSSTDTSVESKTPIVIWIREASYLYNNYELAVDNTSEKAGIIINFYSGNRELLFSEKKQIKAGSSSISGTFKDARNPLYVEITDAKNNVISNRQFVISSESLDSNNPSPESEYRRKRYREIESGKFINGEVLRFIEQILNSTESKLKASSVQEMSGTDKKDEKQGHSFSSLEEYLKDDGSGITGDRSMRNRDSSASQSTMLFDSMISYISRSAKEKEEEEMDDEESEDVQKSEGKDTVKTEKAAIKSPRNAEDIRLRVTKMFNKYIEQLESVALSGKPSRNTIRMMDSLKKYMAAIFFLFRTFSYRYILEDGETEEQSLIRLLRQSGNPNTATEIFYRITSLFALYLKHSTLVKEKNPVINAKNDQYKQYAFELAIAVFSICDWMNQGNADYSSWSDSYKGTSLLNLKKILDVKIEQDTPSIVFKCMDRAIQEIDGFDKATMQNYINRNISLINSKKDIFPQGNILWTDEFGYVKLKPYKATMSLPLTMSYPYNNKYDEYCPDYLYLPGRNKIYPIRQSI